MQFITMTKAWNTNKENNNMNQKEIVRSDALGE